MKKNVPSIKSTLLKWLTIPLFLFVIVIFIYTSNILKTKVTSFFDNRLLASAKSIERNISVINSQLYIDFPNFSIELLYTNDNGLVYYSVVDDKNNLLIGYDKLIDARILKDDENIHFYNKKYDDSFIRVITYKTTFYSNGKSYHAYISLGETTQERDESINDILNILFIMISIIVLFALIVTIFAVTQGLKPMNKLKKIIKQRDKNNLEPIVFNAPKEMSDIVNSMNILLQRSRDTVEYIEQFNSDVSHQLRTPLAEMQVKLELLYDKKDKNYIALNSQINEMSHITEQLLLHAKSNPNTLNTKRFEKTNLNNLCKNYSIKTAPRVYKKGFEFAFIDLDEQIIINCDTILIESMLDNLINNALHYAVDEFGNPMGTITLSLERHNNTIWLNIKDEGNGVDKKLLKNIFKRYYRVDSKKSGTGLGLNIVKQIATIHNAKVEAINEQGLKISIIFNHRLN